MEADPAVPHILVADDMPANLDVIRRMLGECGYKVFPAPNGRLALRAAQRHAPDLIMLDSEMPEMDGFEACRHLSQDEDLSRIPVILVGAKATVQDKVKAFQCGAVDYIEKPFRLEEVRVRVETHLRLRHEIAERRLAEDLLDRVLNVLGEGVVYIDTEGIVRLANETFLRQWKLCGDIVGKTCHELLGEQLCRGDGTCALNGKTLPPGSIQNRVEEELETVLQDGTRKVFADMRSTVTGRDGAALGVVISLRDITERRREEQESRMAASRLRATLESTTDGILVNDLVGAITSYNQQFLDIWGLTASFLTETESEARLAVILPQLASPDEFIDKAMYLFEHPEEEDSCRLHLQDGRVIDLYSIPQRLEERPVGRVWSFREVTEQVQKDKAVRRQSERLQSLQRIMSNPESSESEILQATISESCRLLDMERTYVGRVEGTTRIVEFAFPPEGQPSPGARHDLSDICCGMPIRAQGPVLVHDLANSEYRESPCHQRGFAAYAGIPVGTSRGDYGVLSFTSKSPRRAAFDEEDRDFLVIIAGLVGAMLDRLESKRELLEHNQELEAFNQAMVDREMRVIELKEEVNRLAQELGRPKPYEEVWSDPSIGVEGPDE